MGRHELRVPDGGLGDFARGLRELRRRAGNAAAVEVGAAEVMIQMTGSGAAGPLRLSCSRT